jgi:tellurite resistance protein TerC
VNIPSIGSPALWIGFTVFVAVMLVLDLVVFHRKAHEVSLRESLLWTAVWIGLALAFNGGVYFWFGSERALEFLTGYVIEKALSVDNLFVFLLIFSYFAVPTALQHRVLLWGIVSALILRAVFIFAGAALLQKFHWVIYVFGGILVITAIKLMIQKDEEIHPEKNPVLRLFKKIMPVLADYRGSKFFVVEGGRRYATALFMVLLVVETTDIIFAVDSIPAVFAVTRDPFIVYTSNIFAVLGLRALFFALAGVMGKFHYLKIGLALVLAFVGGKMLISSVYKVPIGLALGAIAVILAGSIVASILRPPAKIHLEKPVL